MKVVIIGGGKVGRKLVSELNSEGHDVILIDIKSSVTEQLQDQYDVMGICGSGSDIEVLKEAGIKNTDLLVAVTDKDEFNALCAVIGKKLGAKKCVARVRNMEYSKQLPFMRDVLGVNHIVNPEYYAASDISRTLRFPAAIKTETFARGRVELAEMRMPESLDGKALRQIYTTYKVKVLICAVQRGDSVIIPNGDFILRSGDKIYITATHAALASFLKLTGIDNQRIKNVLIIGGGRIAFYLVKQLSEIGMKVKIIEHDMNQCELLAGYFSNVTVVCGDGTDQQVLEEEGINTYDSLVSLTGIDEENIIISMYAKTKKNMDKVITKIDRDIMPQVITATGIDSIVSPKDITANTILRYARAMEVSEDTEINALYRIVGGRAEAIEFRITRESALTSTPLRKLGLKDNILIAAIIKGNQVVTPDGDSTIEVGDSLVLVTTKPLKKLGEILM